MLLATITGEANGQRYNPAPGMHELSADLSHHQGGEADRDSGLPLLSRPAEEADSESGCWPFPDYECTSWWWVDGCESGHGTDPRTYDLEAQNGGRLQISKSVWQTFFAVNYGWVWEDVVLDDNINRQAAYVIYLRAGGSWSPWSCRPF